ncbi:polyprenyl synthetase family protein [Inconstantimicrobium mannanitabidum]|uniref:Geranylgeranyl pyrophosphate synthase n=1 Tax=Inconstantimicrobium mannanitabidum TaxID=1604901 RepID=A0ACB5RAE4_9CLOT|nr:farnesyl diphosphate synthase [Clostridium sp. TW13]GKX66158.1 geranylgeranyl pyrophosphate synthase [Clostridium sp. TW13]
MDKSNLKLYVDEYLKQYFLNKGSYNKLIYESMGYSINVGGKRIRPILMLLTYGIYKEDLENILPMAASIEMIHTYSLIHDDLPAMDNDDLRRGKPTNHKVFGDAIAVLAGDGLLNEAMNVMLEFTLNSNCIEAIKATKIISNAAGVEGMVGGQVVDILAEGKDIDMDTLRYMHEKKTGALIKASILAGAVLAKAPEADMRILEEYGEKLGLAFQIKDDILDVIGDEKKLGKKVNVDCEHDKNNYISFYGLDKCKEMCSLLTEDCIKLLDSLSMNCIDLKHLTKILLNREN